MKRDAYAEVTNKIIASIEAGAGDWSMPWVETHGMPTNATTHRAYTGVNALSLWASGRHDPHWATYRQWQSIGAQVRKGERAELILVPMTAKRTETTDDGDETTVARTYFRGAAVFNSAQVDGFEPPAPRTVDETTMVHEVDAIATASGVTIVHGSNHASYSPMTDEVHMPHRTAFVGTATSTPTVAYYGTLIHELVHATGHDSRLARNLTGRFGTEAYAMEELVAELGSAFVASETGLTVEPRADTSAYLQSWLRVLKADKRAIHTAASHASKAAAWLTERSEA